MKFFSFQFQIKWFHFQHDIHSELQEGGSKSEEQGKDSGLSVG